MNSEQKDLYLQKSEILKALSHYIRLAIIDFLRESPKTVEEITNFLNEKQSNISKHLFILKKAGLVDNKKVGLKRFYFIKYSCVSKFSLCVSETLKKKLSYVKKLRKLL